MIYSKEEWIHPLWKGPDSAAASLYFHVLTIYYLLCVTYQCRNQRLVFYSCLHNSVPFVDRQNSHNSCKHIGSRALCKIKPKENQHYSGTGQFSLSMREDNVRWHWMTDSFDWSCILLNVVCFRNTCAWYWNMWKEETVVLCWKMLVVLYPSIWPGLYWSICIDQRLIWNAPLRWSILASYFNFHCCFSVRNLATITWLFSLLLCKLWSILKSGFKWSNWCQRDSFL